MPELTPDEIKAELTEIEFDYYDEDPLEGIKDPVSEFLESLAACRRQLREAREMLKNYRHGVAPTLKTVDAFLAERCEKAENPGECAWAYSDDDTDSWDTACDNKHQFTEGTPTDNYYKFCPYCGKKIKEEK